VAQLILVIDDEPDLLAMVTDVLKFSGYDVVVANHPDTVLAIAADHHPALFLIDMMLPKMTGIELAQTMCEQGYANTPMVGMSASRLMRQLAAESGLFAAVLDKPFELATLVSVLQRHLSDGAHAHR
jgi:CheY-like chemotaxis protein